MKNLYISDSALLECLARNDRAAMNEIYERYYQPLVKWIVSKGGADVDAEDAFQEAVLVLYEKSKEIEFCLSASIGTYLFAICKRLWLKKINKKAHTDTLYLDEVMDQWEGGYEDSDIHQFKEKEYTYQQLFLSMDQLGYPCNELLKAFYIENKSMQDIAEKFKYTNAENAKTQKYKCLTRLKKIFFDKEKNKISVD